MSGIKNSIAFLMKNDITLKAFLEKLYYGLHNHFIRHFLLYKNYIKQRNQIAVNFTREDEFKVIDYEKELKNAKVILTELGFVTSGVLMITMDFSFKETILFEEVPSNYILKPDRNLLKYNMIAY